MSETALPDEIVSEILSPALRVCDEKFSDTSLVSPFTEYCEPTSAYLLVCKSWLRVATPLLYHDVVIRSKALARTLSSNKDLGQFIKRLRVEGGYGAPMRTILKSSPHVSHLYVSLDVFCTDNTTGLCDGLRLISPSCLIIFDHLINGQANNKMALKLVGGLAEAIAGWDDLRVLHLPCLLRRPILIDTLVYVGKLHTIVVPDLYWAEKVYSEFKTCPLRSIQITEACPDAIVDKLATERPEYHSLVQFMNLVPSCPSTVELPDTFPDIHLIPMESASPEVKEAVWKRILYFALLPYYYTHIQVDNDGAQLPKLAMVLEKNPWLGPHIQTIVGELCASRSLEFAESAHLGGFNAAEIMAAHRGHLMTILSHTVGLVYLGTGRSYSQGLSSGDIQWNAFELLASRSGHTLQKLSIRIMYHGTDGARVSPAVLGHLTELDQQNIPSTALPNLEELCFRAGDASFWEVLSRMDLPSLRTLTLQNQEPSALDFFISHGRKLVSLACGRSDVGEHGLFALCPNLKILIISLVLPGGSWSQIPDAENFTSNTVVSRELEKIVVDRNNCSWHRGQYVH
ncbi:hypothetical protein FB45DRAFT_1044174 [Roridomyces roridus]|uniref:Uncharacterized protein n=1 Tax=Roridomyces roridus TaxID=1738132 RepID=A0AAD7F8Z8_9AGAR|nr:hypothetical protein FB45DRAFT_1044174 [Roridomyces roridus]